MTPNWVDLIQNPQELKTLYPTSPPLHAVTLRSVHLNRYGHALTLRIDLPEFPPDPPVEWREAGFDRFQCQLRFVAVEHLEMADWNPPVTADLRFDECGAHRIRVRVESPGLRLTFEAADAVVIGHMSAFKAGEAGADDGPHQFVGKLDSRKFSRLPNLDEKTFYERI
ncbi:Imm50 family immunity protein [Streptomyces xantholiticus]|uniref:Imm50 family immunity protein n=1 Tax=Streptomyces xantholiticus TaxID=68285 RepID=UPI00167A3999|nr:Imm50 family immunity protein [Streptomyces xantholiticus]GGW58626.1 hypothetical protein GCM10010381_49690 [Streptomyces xantholiticus]